MYLSINRGNLWKIFQVAKGGGIKDEKCATFMPAFKALLPTCETLAVKLLHVSAKALPYRRKKDVKQAINFILALQLYILAAKIHILARQMYILAAKMKFIACIASF